MSGTRPRSRPTTAVRRRRKNQLAYHYRWRCAYCRHRFASLSDATIDHIAPYTLWRTWSLTALALACLDCNHRKADRLPLSIALLLCATARPMPVNEREQSSVHVNPEVFTTPFTLATWCLLARLAHALQSTPHQGEHPREHAHERREHPIVHALHTADRSTRLHPIEAERTAA